ncbi:MAG: VWA domain-containing protein [Rubellimicrobium sp.]|nr:VWA domain-containing protein [Rubellimicrobium sp.]
MAAFRAAEDGSMIVFALFLFVIMLMIGGMAVDLMRFESVRARLQSTLDRAVLAAADLDQRLDPTAVVYDYFDKDRLLSQLTHVEVTETMNSRSVGALARMDMNTFFMRMVGYPSLTAPAAGRAIESVNDIEIILVLDVSGSMNDNRRLVNLKSAANDFVDTILAADTEDRMSIGIVPFNGQINLGPQLRAQYNTTDDHGVANSNCVDLTPAAYATADLSTTLPLPMTAYADTFSGPSSTGSGYTVPTSNRPAAANYWCPATPGNTVLLPTRNATTLHNRINGLTAIGATSINAGMRWGIELLDPGTQPMFASLAAAGQMPSAYADRPYAYDRDDALKVIVLMSDGSNFAEQRVNNGYRSGPSPIWRANNGQYSIFDATRVNSSNSTNLCNSRPYYVPHLNAWHPRPWNGSNPPAGTSKNPTCYQPNATTSSTTNLNWEAVWLDVRVKWVAQQLFARSEMVAGSNYTQRYNNAVAMLQTETPIPQMDAQLQAMCQVARSHGTTVFSIAFEAPSDGQLQLSQCASSPSHYFNAQGLEIADAFRAIAAQINRLRLVE